MRKHFVLLLLALGILAACEKPPVVPPTPESKDVALDVTPPAASGFAWREGDVISVYATDGKFYDFKLNTAAVRPNVFMGTIPYEAEVTTFALYPPVQAGAYADGKLTVTLPRELTADGARQEVPMVATFERGASVLTFRQVTGFLKFTVTSAPKQFDAVVTFKGKDPVGTFVFDPREAGAKLVAPAAAEATVLVHCTASDGGAAEFSVPVATGSWDVLHLALSSGGKTLYEKDLAREGGAVYTVDCGETLAVRSVQAVPAAYGGLSVPMSGLPNGCVFRLETEYGTTDEIYDGARDGAYTFTAQVPLGAEQATLSLRLPDGRALFERDIRDLLPKLSAETPYALESIDAVLAEIAWLEARHGGANSISFMHISDLHNRDVTLNKMTALITAADVPFAVISGDMYYSGAMVHTIRNTGKPIYSIAGNHDIYIYYGGWRAAGKYPFEPNYCFRYEHMNQWFNVNMAATAHYGSEMACYFYADHKVGDKTLRLICLDQYDGGTAGWNEDNDTIISQEEVDWLIDLLGKSGDVDGIIIAGHEGYGNGIKGQRDINHEDEFISVKAKYYARSYAYDGQGDPLLIPEIVQAYISGQNLEGKQFLSGAQRRKDGSSVPPETTVTVTTHFTGPHNNFITYLGGHLHWDMAEYLKDYPKQLQILVANGFSETYYSAYHDLTYKDLPYTINYCVVNFDAKTLTIHRLGSRQTSAGTYRLEETFPLGQQ